MDSSIKRIIRFAVFTFVVFFLAYIGLNLARIYDSNLERKQLLEQLLPQIAVLSLRVWSFIQPFLQIILIIVIVLWLLERLGINLKPQEAGFDWDVQKIIALIVIGAFAMAALAGIDGSISALKDLALVVIGFYFGTQKRSVEITDKGAKIMDEHVNPTEQTQQNNP
jgi:Na+/H+ antiporter NhaC